MKIAYGTYAMPKTPLEEAIPLLAGMGYDGVEICIDPRHVGSMPDQFNTARCTTIRALLRQHRMGIPALFMTGHILQEEEAGHRANLEHTRRTVQLARDLGMDETPVLSMGIGGKSDRWENQCDAIVERLHDFAVLGAEEGFIMAGEAHCGAAVDRSERALRVIHAVNSPHVRLHFDMVHFYLSGEREEDAVRRLVPITAHTHVMDARRYQDGTFDLLLLGDGDLDTVAYVKAMHEAGWTGFITLEVSARLWQRDDYDPVHAAKFSCATLHTAFQQAGIPRG